MTLRDIFPVFSRLGFLGFGGPVATIAMMEEETTRKRAWVSSGEFAEMLAVCKLLPGPVATQMAIFLGLRRGGRWGGLLSGLCFILPSFFLVLLFSYVYTRTGVVQKYQPLFTGMQSGALAVILLSTIQLGRPYRKDTRAWLVAAISAVVVLARPSFEPLVILAAGLLGIWLSREPRSNRALGVAFPVLAQLFVTCLKAGTLVFGTGLAVVPMLEADAVARFGWLTHSEFMDGLAIGQITPGPVVITSTFIGYKTAGLAGAIAATTGIFLPGFINILFIVPHVFKRLSGTPAAKGFLSLAIPAVVGGIIGSGLRLGGQTLVTPLAGGVFALALFAGFRLKISAWMLIPAAGAFAALVELAL